MRTDAPTRPLIGLLYNPAVPALLDEVQDLVEYLEVIPDRLWYDFASEGPTEQRFRHVRGALKTLRRCAEGRVVGGHGIGLSLPSAMPLDMAMVEQVVALHRQLGFAWYSEHLSMFLTPKRSVPNAQAGLGLPMPFDAEMLTVIAPKLASLRDALGLRLLLENGAQFTPVPYAELPEHEFHNRLHAEADCGTLLDLHNLYVNVRNGGADAVAFLEALEPEAVEEIHLAGGDLLAGFYTDSHSRLTPPEVWEWAETYAPRFPNLRAIVFEFHESYYPRLGPRGIAAELERMHELAATLPVRELAGHAR